MLHFGVPHSTLKKKKQEKNLKKNPQRLYILKVHQIYIR